MTRWLVTVVLALSACAGASDPNAHTDAGSGGAAAVGGFDPFGDAALGGGGGCDAGIEAAVSDAATDALDPECQGVAGASYKDVAPILNGCTGEVCHVSPTFGSLVGQASHECCDGRLLVSPGHPSASYLVDKLTGKNLCGGVAMPSGKPSLGDDEIAVIVSWICSGAPEQ